MKFWELQLVHSISLKLENKIASHSDVSVGEVSPAEQIHQAVEAGQFTSRLFLTLNHGAGLGAEEIVYGGHHAQAWGV